MTDPRFTSLCDDADQLLETLELDTLDDLGTLLMVLFGRPVGVEAREAETGVPTLEVLLRGEGATYGFDETFPMSVVQLARSFAQTADGLGPYVSDDPAPTHDVSTMTDGELISALQRALGMVRVFGLMEGEE